MNNRLFIISIILVIAWAIGFLGLSLGGLIHILLAIAFISLIIGLFQRMNKI